MNKLKMMKHNFWEMPYLLKLLTICTILWVFLIVRAFWPFTSFYFYGIPITYVEYWASGLGISHVGFSSLLVWCGYLFLIKSPKARSFYVGAWSALLCFSYIFLLIHLGLEEILRTTHIWSDLMFWSGFTLLIAWYLFSKQSVQDYFLSTKG